MANLVCFSGAKPFRSCMWVRYVIITIVFEEICESDVYKFSITIKMLIKFNYFQVLSISGSQIATERLAV